MELGKKGELLAKRYLEKEDYKILETNFRTRYGEIDVIALYENEIVFIEVKARSSIAHGLPCEAVNRNKQMKIRRVAGYYLLVSGNNGRNCRMDVIEILITDRRRFLRHIRDAF